MNKILMRQRIENAQKELTVKRMIVQNGKNASALSFYAPERVDE